MKNKLFIDTDILIDIGRNEKTAVDRIKHEGKTSVLYIGSITQMELIVGCRNRDELKELNKFLERFEIIHLTENISNNAIDLLKAYRLSHGLLIPDALIEATAIYFDMPFLSKNQKDYRFIEGLKLQSYP
jgi:predicted nucleic acid-binding protein